MTVHAEPGAVRGAVPRTAGTRRVPSGGASRLAAAAGAARVGLVVRRLPRTALVGVVRAYQLVISPWTPPSCRYYPSCSQYALVALERHGALRGGWLALKRLGRCHPWTAGGVDDVPPARELSDGSPDPVGRPSPTTPTAAAGGSAVCHEHADRARSSAR